MPAAKKIYFASDFHLGADAKLSSKERELKLVCWLDKIKDDAAEIYLLGDVFDHWFEYKTVVPRGFLDFIGKLAELRRLGIPIYLFTGNHDMWMFGFFEKELGIPVYRNAIIKEFNGKKFYLLHGDGLPTDNWINRLMRYAFSNRFLQWSFARLHPNLAIGIMKYFSNRSRLAHAANDMIFDLANEKMIDYSNQLIQQKKDLDYIIMGHRHLPVDILLKNGKTRHLNLGDWIHYFSYAVFDGKELKIEFFEDAHTVFST